MRLRKRIAKKVSSAARKAKPCELTRQGYAPKAEINKQDLSIHEIGNRTTIGMVHPVSKNGSVLRSSEITHSLLKFQRQNGNRFVQRAINRFYHLEHNDGKTTARSVKAVGDHSNSFDTSEHAFIRSEALGLVRHSAEHALTFGRDITAKNQDLNARKAAPLIKKSTQTTNNVIQCTAASCPSGWNASVRSDHNRALGMIDRARSKLSRYNGTTPADVKTALDRHFKASSSGFAGWVSLNLWILRNMARLASYDCEDTSSWWCSSGNTAKTFWCVPFVDIRVCQPVYFSHSALERSETLIHEWVHKYGCNFDLGYAHESDYPSQWTITALINADPWSEFVQDVA